MNLMRKRKRGSPFCPLCVDCRLVQRWPCSLVGLEPHGETGPLPFPILPGQTGRMHRPRGLGGIADGLGWGVRAESRGLWGHGWPTRPGAQGGEGVHRPADSVLGPPGQRGALGACGRLATLFTLHQDTTSWVWEGPRQQGKANPRVRSPPQRGAGPRQSPSAPPPGPV